jgi:hypothetical protein
MDDPDAPRQEGHIILDKHQNPERRALKKYRCSLTGLRAAHGYPAIVAEVAPKFPFAAEKCQLTQIFGIISNRI